MRTHALVQYVEQTLIFYCYFQRVEIKMKKLEDVYILGVSDELARDRKSVCEHVVCLCVCVCVCAFVCERALAWV